MRRSLTVLVGLAVLATAVVGGGLAYQAAAREREYQALLSRGDAALRDDQTFGAIEAYSGAVAWLPESMLAHLRRGETYQRRGDLTAAARDFRTAAALDPTAVRPLEELGDVLYQQGRFRSAAGVYERGLAIDDRSARLGYKLALARYREGNVAAAVTTLNAAVRQGDSTVETHYLLGLCFRDLGRLADAQRALEHAVRLSPGLIAAREELSEVYALQGRRRDELDELQTIAGLDRDRVERQVAVALAQARAGRTEPAILTLGAALERRPDQPMAYTVLGRLWLDVAESRGDPFALNKAVEGLERAAASPTASSETLTLYGRALLGTGAIEPAEHALREATTRYPIDPSSLLHYADAAERQNHLDAARQALVDYGSLVIDDGQIAGRAERIAALSMRLNDYAPAIRWLQRALDDRPHDANLLASLADAHSKAGDREAAQAAITRGLEIDPAHAGLLALKRRIK